MQTLIGLWLDHRKALIVHASDKARDITVIQSHAERHPGRIDGKRSTESYESLLVPADDVRDRKFLQQLDRYYDEIIACVRAAESLLVFGPGEAKLEFQKRLDKEKRGERRVTVETTDKMTDRQIEAKVRDFFTPKSPTIIL